MDAVSWITTQGIFVALHVDDMQYAWDISIKMTGTLEL
jgi:hypothetical protein